MPGSGWSVLPVRMNERMTIKKASIKEVKNKWISSESCA
jgi:hypothetical protein